MKLRTEINVPEGLAAIGYDTSLLMMGSCFSDNIGEYLKKYLFHIDINPFGVSYNPMSIHNGIRALLEKKEYVEADIDSFNGLYFSFDHYTKFSSPDREQVLEMINQRFAGAKKGLKEAKYILLTFGTAFVYQHHNTGRIVNNCHKIPAREFTRTLLTPDEIITAYSNLVKKVSSVNPEAKFLFTVSPVRHIKDGLEENQLSKAILILASREIIKNHPGRCSYFPSYEILMDDLRDYRFYAMDLVHPNDQAVQYVWEKFKASCIDEQAKSIMQELDPVLKALSHRPLHPSTDTYRDFQGKIREKIRVLKDKYDRLNWSSLHLI